MSCCVAATNLMQSIPVFCSLFYYLSSMNGMLNRTSGIYELLCKSKDIINDLNITSELAKFTYKGLVNANTAIENNEVKGMYKYR